jgi:predicted dehydrogenase
MKMLGLIGYGQIAKEHIKVFRSLNAEVVASCNRSEKGKKMAFEEMSILRTYSSIPEMIEREKLDGIICCVSFWNNYSVAKELIPYGIPILLEKPPGTSLDEVIELRKMVAKYSTPLIVGMNRRHYSILTKAIDDAGGLNSIVSVEVVWSEEPQKYINRGLSYHQVSRLIFSNSLHGLDLITFLAGGIIDPIIIAHCNLSPFSWEMSMQGTSDRGVITSFNSSWIHPAKWSLALNTPIKKYFFSPLETCVISNENKQTKALYQDTIDNQYKPGFYDQGVHFLDVINKKVEGSEHNIESVIPAMEIAEMLTNECFIQDKNSDFIEKKSKQDIFI